MREGGGVDTPTHTMFAYIHLHHKGYDFVHRDEFGNSTCKRMLFTNLKTKLIFVS